MRCSIVQAMHNAYHSGATDGTESIPYFLDSHPLRPHTSAKNAVRLRRAEVMQTPVIPQVCQIHAPEPAPATRPMPPAAKKRDIMVAREVATTSVQREMTATMENSKVRKTAKSPANAPARECSPSVEMIPKDKDAPMNPTRIARLMPIRSAKSAMLPDPQSSATPMTAVPIPRATTLR